MTYIAHMLYSRYRIIFYRTAVGRCQACDYAREMSEPHQAKAKRWFIELTRKGPALTAPYGKYLRDGVWELRVIIGHHQHRFLYGFHKDVVIVTNAFLKKCAAVPDDEIGAARKALVDWIRRYGG